MRRSGAVGAGCVLPVLLVALLTGCRPGVPGSAAPASEPQLAGYGAVFLGVDECSSFGTTRVTEVPCTGERAAARVIARYDGRPEDGPLCPPTTDFVLHISPQRAGGGEAGDVAIPRGYACMRKLEPPHPGDPGGGGGPRTVPGDCVYRAGRGQVRETACDGSGRSEPEYRVTRAVRDRAECPPSTALYVEIGGSLPVGCARRL
ncbi:MULTISPECIES: hypothetical protein [Streptomyces]|uniref:Lipoprotein n=1 Tax=Streptomyces thermoviolaceus subsp. thermoviolaceus TaxID=66860 RepID=A0ABX0Z1Z5_STRTL|nr:MULTISPECIES: hypothetical protein [Streptomyces]MCM3265734.1 hypothetical protein [Streptomyces thermoviolaceus]NJP17225.1 hypothetical protein [Streptomyces thermoviolaceus subsp. thermoviolaceus]RSS01213.1 hypothetical protein EF917_16125 [Streptomyces sp. WAC00469]GHB09210.1 hypothetical protein GCM10010512_45880 [Streptomyces thermoviolaceus subsp. thermoviolaceus]